MIDRDQLREALEWWDREARFDPHFMLQGFDTFILAARLVADPDTLTITKVDGEWPDWLTEAIDPDAYIAALEGQPK